MRAGQGTKPGGWRYTSGHGSSKMHYFPAHEEGVKSACGKYELFGFGSESRIYLRDELPSDEHGCVRCRRDGPQREGAQRCGEPVQKCLEVGEHSPACTCDLDKGHRGKIHRTKPARGGRPPG